MDWGTRLFRSMLLGLAGNRLAESLSNRYGMKLGAGRFVAGETLEEALEKIKALNAKGIAVTVDHLGESVRDPAEADNYRNEYLRLVDAIAREGVTGNVSLKPTQMGLSLDRGACLERIRAIAEAASRHGMFVRLDMENSPYTAATIDLVRALRREGLPNVGTVIQAYLYRSGKDVVELTAEGVNLRLVKGAYKEPPRIAFPNRRDVDANFRQLIGTRLDSGVYTAVATHDTDIIDWTKWYAKRKRIPRDRFEFQMLYGIRTPLQEELAREGYTVRSYVPYGRMWYPYFVRRLAERPANVGFIVRNLLARR